MHRVGPTSDAKYPRAGPLLSILVTLGLATNAVTLLLQEAYCSCQHLSLV